MKSKQPLENGSPLHLSAFCYADIELIKGLAIGRCSRSLLEQMPPVSSLEPLSQWIGGVITWLGDIFQQVDLVAAPWDDGGVQQDDCEEGGLVCVRHAFRTKGVGCWKGKDWRIGEIYRRTGKGGLRMLIDPNWVFPGHGQAKFCSGRTTFGGIVALAGYDNASSTVIARPVVLGDLAFSLSLALCGAPGYRVCRPSV